MGAGNIPRDKMTDINLEQVEVYNEAELKDQVSKVLMEEESQSPPKRLENGVSSDALETVETVLETAINDSIETCEEKSDTILESQESKEESAFLTEIDEETPPKDKATTVVESESSTLLVDVEDRKENDENKPQEKVEMINETVINDTIATCKEESSPTLESEVSQEESTFMTEVVDRDEKDKKQHQANDSDCLEQLKMSIEESEREFPIENQDESPVVKNKDNEVELSEIANDESPQINIKENNKTETELQLEDSILDKKIEDNKETSEFSVCTLKVDEIEDIVEDNIKENIPYVKEIVEKEPTAVVGSKSESEKVPVFTLFMIAYVIFMSLILFCH